MTDLVILDVDKIILNSERHTFGGYLRLYCLIKGIPPPPKRCRVCRGEMDAKYKGRHCGYLCLACYRERNRRRAKAYYLKHPERVKATAKRFAQANPIRARSWAIANYTHKERQLCQNSGCKCKGQRHHFDYSKPDEIVWLCPLHHRQIHKLLDKQRMGKV